MTQVSYILFKRRVSQPQEGRGHSTINYTETQSLKTLLSFYGLETLRTLTKSWLVGLLIGSVKSYKHKIIIGGGHLANYLPLSYSWKALVNLNYKT